MITIDERIGGRVAGARMSSGRSQAALAKEMSRLGFDKWSQATVWAVEAGKRPLRFSEAVAIADLTLVTTDSLIPAGGVTIPRDPSAEEILDDIERSVAQFRALHANEEANDDRSDR